jgi:hypothetical protein
MARQTSCDECAGKNFLYSHIRLPVEPVACEMLRPALTAKFACAYWQASAHRPVANHVQASPQEQACLHMDSEKMQHVT